MSYQVLARKWRPHNFEEMVGQEHVLRMLTNALDNQRLHHAYLFTGTRGVGKTTLARILAKCLNCEKGISSNPCGTCSICQAIDTGRFLDLIEVDAASRTKVEDTREILDNVQYAPSQGRYKIYLIDEVHMLSGHSFNALLKTLEEPPAHVKFLLATTDPKRLPITILSRCLQFNLKRVPIEQITQQLQHICKSENIIFEEPALDLVAQAADGSMRDALSLLDQTIAYCRDSITTQDTQQMLGSIEQDAIFRLLAAVAQQDGKKLLAEIAQLSEQAPNFTQVLDDVLAILHKISIAQVIADAPHVNAHIKQLAAQMSAEETQLYYQIALIGRRDLMLAPNPAHGFEMVMLRMLAFKPSEITPTTPVKNVDSQRLTTTSTSAPVATQKTVGVTSATITTSAASVTRATATTSAVVATPTTSGTSASVATSTAPAQSIKTESSSNTSAANPSNNWIEILPKLALTGFTQTLAANCKLKSIANDKIELELATTHEPMLNKKLSDRIEQSLSQYFNKPIKLEIKLAAGDIHTPAKQDQEDKATRHANATESIKNDSNVKKMMDMFNATIDMGSIKAITEEPSGVV